MIMVIKIETMGKKTILWLIRINKIPVALCLKKMTMLNLKNNLCRVLSYSKASLIIGQAPYYFVIRTVVKNNITRDLFVKLIG